MQRGREKGDAKTESKEEGRVVCFLAGGGKSGGEGRGCKDRKDEGKLNI